MGRTGLEITQLGYGCADLMGREAGARKDVSHEDAGKLLNTVLDSGINFIDTAPDYGIGEDIIGDHISHRRDEFYLATKCGCHNTANGTPLDPGHMWTAETFHHNINQSLKRMKTDYVDLIQMHNPGAADVEQNKLVDVLHEIKASGKTRFIGVSSTAPDLPAYIKMGVFDTFQIPYSALQREHEQMIKSAAEAGAGIIIRGGIARGHNDKLERWSKYDRAELENLAEGMSRYDFVLRFTLTHPNCHTTIVGTADLDHLKSNLAVAQVGPLPPDVYDQAMQRLDQIGERPL